MERLRTEKKQLRTKEKQLRTEKEHLRSQLEHQTPPTKKMKCSGMYFVLALYHFSKTSLSVTYNHH